MMRQKERDDFQAFHNDMHVKIAKAVNDRDRYHTPPHQHNNQRTNPHQTYQPTLLTYSYNTPVIGTVCTRLRCTTYH